MVAASPRSRRPSRPEGTATVFPDEDVSLALSGIGSRLGGIAACALGLILASCLAGLAGLLTLDTVVAALGFIAGAGLIGGRVIVCDALGRAGLHPSPSSVSGWAPRAGPVGMKQGCGEAQRGTSAGIPEGGRPNATPER